ncbi:MAG: hypothetical protein Q8T09_04545 [Candidatus Melainabacteria bacterium]|nr:hypothetical protein [Candidatus Melainabacteria bacterium]
MPASKLKNVSSILEYQQLKAAAGGSGGGGQGHGAKRKCLRVNQEIACRILESVPGGYLVKVDDVDLPSYLVSEARIESGQEILAQVFCIHNGSLILCPLAG